MDEIEVIEQRAIDAAINLQWDDAINLNKQILKIDTNNIDACLRLGFAYIQRKMVPEAKKYYLKSLRIRPRNQVALENLERLKVIQVKDTVHHGKDKTKNSTILNPSLFLEVSGKTKSIALVNLGQKKHLASVTVGQEVSLKPKKRKIEVRTLGGDYLGCLPDDLSKRLIFFLKAKSGYKAYVQEASLTRLVIFIQEEKKGKRVAHYTSFPPNIQTNLEKMDSDDDAPDEDEEVTTDEDELESMAERLNEKEAAEESLVEIPSEDPDQDE